MVLLIREEEGRGGHGGEELHELGARSRAEALKVGRDVVYDGNQGGVYRC